MLNLEPVPSIIPNQSVVNTVVDPSPNFNLSKSKKKWLHVSKAPLNFVNALGVEQANTMFNALGTYKKSAKTVAGVAEAMN